MPPAPRPNNFKYLWKVVSVLVVPAVPAVAGQGMTLTADPSCAGGVRCNGTCHGNNEGHNNQCW